MEKDHGGVDTALSLRKVIELIYKFYPIVFSFGALIYNKQYPRGRPVSFPPTFVPSGQNMAMRAFLLLSLPSSKPCIPGHLCADIPTTYIILITHHLLSHSLSLDTLKSLSFTLIISRMTYVELSVSVITVISSILLF